MDIGEGAEQLVDVKLHLKNGHHRLHLVEVPRCTVYSLGNIFKYEIEIDLIFLWLKQLATGRERSARWTGIRTRSPLL